MTIPRADSVGISDIQLYIPRPSIDLKTLVDQRVIKNSRLERHYERALRVTGQRAIRFPEIWEDSATMAARAAFDMLNENPSIDVKSIRHLAVGTETGVDHSKPVSAYVQGMLRKAGMDFPGSLSSFQAQHACAGGTVALMSVAGILAAGSERGESGIIINTDIARYDPETTAEITQGAGAVALVVELSPRLLEIDLASAGYWSDDVDDFFRPLGSVTAQVDGTYSMKCYVESLEKAFLDHSARTGQPPERLLNETDYIVMHTPFRNMPAAALETLFENLLGYSPDRTRAFLEEKSFSAAVDPLADIGNLYTGSLYAGLAFLLKDRHRALGSGIAGKRILLASYGSGNMMIVSSARIAAGAADVVSRWDLEKVSTSARRATFDEYAAWVSSPMEPELYARFMENAPLPADAFLLAGIRKDGYREYEHRKAAQSGNRAQERIAPADLHGSVAISG